MSQYGKYYDDLSGCSSQEEDSASEDELESDLRQPDHVLNRRHENKGVSTARKSPRETSLGVARRESMNDDVSFVPRTDSSSFLTRRIGSEAGVIFSERRYIIHMDVDCFYCQCEMIDKKIPPDRPFAIGQKHIVVTTNYAARQPPYNVQKLESRESALRKCPHLLIIEGSDLERYRQYARTIYNSFRRACKEFSSMLNERECAVAVSKGSMDEVTAELSPKLLEAYSSRPESRRNSDYYVCGSDSTRVSFLAEHNPYFTLYQENGPNHRDIKNQEEVLRHLETAAWMAKSIRETIWKETGFTTTMGVSTNPLGQAGFGRRTVQVLLPCLERHFQGMDRGIHVSNDNKKTKWTCGDLAKVPLADVAAALQTVATYEKSSLEQAKIVLQKCRGIDDSPIKDDDPVSDSTYGNSRLGIKGDIPKTVSVENSFRRGTILTMDDVFSVMPDLCNRLPRLLSQRRSWSSRPSFAFPKTIRVTVRQFTTFIGRDQKTGESTGRPFVVHSKQSNIDGKRLMMLNSPFDEADMIRRAASPLLRSLLSCTDKASSSMNITRINIAMSNFQDVDLTFSKVGDERNFFAEKLVVSPPRQLLDKKGQSFSSPSATKPTFRSRQTPNSLLSLSADDIDPKVMAELPDDIASEVTKSLVGAGKKIISKKRRIDHFFAAKQKT